MREVSTQIEKRRLTDLVIDKLLSKITKGMPKGGDNLPPEPERMKRFGMGMAKDKLPTTYRWR